MRTELGRSAEEDTIEFQGTLDQPITIDEPASVEILAGRPDLVMVNISDEQPRSIGAIHEVGWRQLIPERVINYTPRHPAQHLCSFPNSTVPG